MIQHRSIALTLLIGILGVSSDLSKCLLRYCPKIKVICRSDQSYSERFITNTNLQHRRLYRHGSSDKNEVGRLSGLGHWRIVFGGKLSGFVYCLPAQVDTTCATL